jgi:hypothetical protein
MAAVSSMAPDMELRQPIALRASLGPVFVAQR